MGQSPPSTTYNMNGNGLPFFQGKAEFGSLYPEVRKHCSEPNRIAEPGATLLSVRAPVGPTNLARERCCIGRGLAAIHPLDQIPEKFVLWLLRSREPEISEQGTGSTFSAINRKFLHNLSIPLPPLAEQKRIVSRIEELFSELDAGEAALKKARHQLGVYRQSLLKQAFEGKLTAPWRAQHPDLLESPDQLLTRIQAERQARYERQLEELEAEVNEWEANGEQGRKPTRPKAFAPIHRRDSDESGSIPAQWLWLNLGDASDVTGGLTKNSKRENLALRIPYLRVANVYANELRLDEIKEIGVTTAEARKVRLEAGDLLIVEGNGSLEQIGRVASWNGSIKDCGHQNHLIRSRCFPSANHSFILMFLLSPQGREQIEKQAASTSGLHTLSVSKVHALSVPLCSLPEQQEIVRLLDEQFEVIEQNEHEIGAALKRSAALRQSILKKAFTGHLVPQDSTDEPASALLERIRSERENSAIVPKKKTVRKNFKSPVSPFHE